MGYKPNLLKDHILEIGVFVCGASTMILELLGSRILAPYVGASLYVWTSLIGVILGVLSLGYWWGGQCADRKPEISGFAAVILAAGILIAVVAFFDDAVLLAVESVYADVRFIAIVGTLLLFGFPSFFLGMVLPYAVRLRVISIDQTGSTVGRLYALSTLGSIAGTFLAGFFLIVYLGHTMTLLLLSAILTGLSLLAFTVRKTRYVAVFFIILGLLLLQPRSFSEMLMGTDFIDTNTPYSRVWIYNDAGENGRPMRVLQVNEEHDSVMFLDTDDLAQEYTPYFSLASHFSPSMKSALMIGGAAYSYPMHYLREFPDARIDVVEIDPGITRIATQYFRLKTDPRLRIFHEDARVYLNRTNEKYDAILGDAFKSYSIPFQLTTLEAVRKMHSVLNENGVVIVNIVSSIEGSSGRFLRAEYATFKAVFPNVHILMVNDPNRGRLVQNLILVALKSPAPPAFASENAQFSSMLKNVWVKDVPNDLPVLTDDRVPVERYTANWVSGLRWKGNNPLYVRLRDRLRVFMR